jgi:hypothetical protein
MAKCQQIIHNTKKSKNLSDLNKKDRNKCHSSPFINVVKGVFFVVRVTNKANIYSYSIFVITKKTPLTTFMKGDE